MTGLGLGVGAQMPKAEVAASFATGWLKHIRVAFSAAGGAAVALGLFTLLQQQPVEGFRLLGQWGPWPLIAVVGVFFMGRFFSRMNDTVQVTFGAIVTSVQQQAQSGSKTAEALSRLADQNGRQGQEVERLAIYAAREFPLIYERFDQLDETTKMLAGSVQRLHEHLDEIAEKAEKAGG